MIEDKLGVCVAFIYIKIDGYYENYFFGVDDLLFIDNWFGCLSVCYVVDDFFVILCYVRGESDG